MASDDVEMGIEGNLHEPEKADCPNIVQNSNIDTSSDCERSAWEHS